MISPLATVSCATRCFNHICSGTILDTPAEARIVLTFLAVLGSVKDQLLTACRLIIDKLFEFLYLD